MPEHVFVGAAVRVEESSCSARVLYADDVVLGQGSVVVLGLGVTDKSRADDGLADLGVGQGKVARTDEKRNPSPGLASLLEGKDGGGEDLYGRADLLKAGSVGPFMFSHVHELRVERVRAADFFAKIRRPGVWRAS